MPNKSVSNDHAWQESQHYWDTQAAAFDDEPDHGLRDPAIREAWSQLLAGWLPAHPSAILDAGCGTGSLSVLLSGLGHVVTGIDLSPAMIWHAQAKARAAHQQIEFQVMNAAFPEFSSRQFDTIVCRHLLWALPAFPQVLRRWADLLKTNGRLILIEGYWNTGSGLHANEIMDALPSVLTHVECHNLSNQPVYWGKEVQDERYAIIAECA